MEDDSHTVEVRFRLEVEPTVERDPSAGRLYQLMEGKGMLMIDREDGQASHTMWVVKPIAPPRYEHETFHVEADDRAPEPASSTLATFGDRRPNEPTTPFPFSQPIMVDPILCRICECQIPQWYFEKHSETCAETHRLEAEIVECNESIAELRNTIRDLIVAVDRSSSTAIPEYRGMPIFLQTSSPASPLQLFRAGRMQRFGVKKTQKRLLDQLDDILQVAFEVSMPALKDEEAKEPIERQRLLSPGSERKISQIRNWAKPATEDAALSQLLQDAERVMRHKIDNVVRMQNTIRYAEKIWHEWEERVGEVLATVEESDVSDEEDGEEDGDHENERDRENEGDDKSSMKSAYAFTSDTSSGPTPIASSSPAPTPTSYEPRTSIPLPSAPIPIYGQRQSFHTRSSTPSSVSSPLALAAPIVAPSTADDAMPPMTLDDVPTLQIKPRKSNQSLLEPKFIVTPPTSPLFAPRDVPPLTRETSMKRGHRRHSTINPVATTSGPLSPRQSPAASLSRTTPASIKDFDIIKPISKGAFGSVFLAKKKVTGDYYAIKVLKKADMIAKNQITNVKAERMILMKQADSPFVAKLYFTFQSKDNLYLVMEYLNGGDCAALIKSLGSLPEEWTKNYIAEVVLGLEYLHQRGVVHRCVVLNIYTNLSTD
jgi:serine/threonine-protein kinase RIM15